jgi:RecA/RadA recombinase
MLAAATTAARGERVAYVDTSNAFSPHRAAEMMRGAPGRVRPVEELLDLITVVRAYTAHSALAALDALLLQAGAGGAPRLVILDSIGAVVSPVLGGGAAHSQGHALLVAIAGALKELGERLGAGVVVTNHLVGGGGGDGGGGGRQERRAALGESWAGQAHVRVQLAASPCEGAPCTATLRASTSAAPGAAVRYWLTAAGPAGRPEGEAAQQPGRAPPG